MSHPDRKVPWWFTGDYVTWLKIQEHRRLVKTGSMRTGAKKHNRSDRRKAKLAAKNGEEFTEKDKHSYWWD